jgi:hypothetical protein
VDDDRSCGQTSTELSWLRAQAEAAALLGDPVPVGVLVEPDFDDESEDEDSLAADEDSFAGVDEEVSEGLEPARLSVR